MLRSVVLVVCLALGNGSASADDCWFNLADVPNPPRFEDYPVEASTIARPAAPRPQTPLAHEFRTVIRRGAAAGPNFAGPYTVVGWGCGAECAWSAIVDARNGRVFTDDRIGDVYTGDVNEEPIGPEPPWFGLR